jgi:hypothetical protein
LIAASKARAMPLFFRQMRGMLRTILGLYVLAMMGAEGTMVVDGGAGGGGQITKKRKNGDRGIESGTQVSLEHAASAIRDLTIQAESTTTATISIKMGWMEAATKGKESQKLTQNSSEEEQSNRAGRHLESRRS